MYYVHKKIISFFAPPPPKKMSPQEQLIEYAQRIDVLANISVYSVVQYRRDQQAEPYRAAWDYITCSIESVSRVYGKTIHAVTRDISRATRKYIHGRVVAAKQQQQQ